MIFWLLLQACNIEHDCPSNVKVSYEIIFFPIQMAMMPMNKQSQIVLTRIFGGTSQVLPHMYTQTHKTNAPDRQLCISTEQDIKR